MKTYLTASLGLCLMGCGSDDSELQSIEQLIPDGIYQAESIEMIVRPIEITGMAETVFNATIEGEYLLNLKLIDGNKYQMDYVGTTAMANWTMEGVENTVVGCPDDLKSIVNINEDNTIEHIESENCGESEGEDTTESKIEFDTDTMTFSWKEPHESAPLFVKMKWRIK